MRPVQTLTAGLRAPQGPTAVPAPGMRDRRLVFRAPVGLAWLGRATACATKARDSRTPRARPMSLPVAADVRLGPLRTAGSVKRAQASPGRNTVTPF